MKRFKGEEWQAIVKRCNRVAELLWEDGPVRRFCNCVFAFSGIVIAAALLLVTRVHPLTAIFAAFVGATIYESVRYAVATAKQEEMGSEAILCTRCLVEDLDERVARLEEAQFRQLDETEEASQRFHLDAIRNAA